MATHEEKSTADKLLSMRCNAERLTSWNAMAMMENASPELLKASGHVSREAAIVYLFTATQKRIRAMVMDHLKQYPDN